MATARLLASWGALINATGIARADFGPLPVAIPVEGRQLVVVADVSDEVASKTAM